MSVKAKTECFSKRANHFSSQDYQRSKRQQVLGRFSEEETGVPLIVYYTSFNKYNYVCHINLEIVKKRIAQETENLLHIVLVISK